MSCTVYNFFFFFSWSIKRSCSVWLYHARLLHPWNFPGKSTRVDCHFLLQGIFPTQGSNQGLPHCKQTLLLSEPPGKILTHIENRLIFFCFSARVFQDVAWFCFSIYYCYACWRKQRKRRFLFHGSRKKTEYLYFCFDKIQILLGLSVAWKLKNRKQ